MSDLPAGDPRHGSIAGRSAGCACFRCRLAKSSYAQTRNRRLAYGTWQPWVDAEPVRTHLRYLSQYGIGWERVARLAGLPDATVSGILYARGRDRVRPATRCRERTAQLILAITPTLDNIADGVHIDATGTARRLRALVAVGHNMESIGKRLPMHPESARMLIRHRGQVTAAIARAVRDLYDELYQVRPAGWVADRARGMATREGWAPPGAWDDDTIDDPATQPRLHADLDEPLVDEVLVQRVLDGEAKYTDLDDANRFVVVEYYTARGLSPQQVASRVKTSALSIRRLLAQPPTAAEAA